MSKKSVLVIVGALCFGAFVCGAATSLLVGAQSDYPVLPAQVSFSTFFFNKNLSLGDNNEDVRQLQILLNKSPATQVAQEGVGSSGFESTYFGLLTQLAVVHFQTQNQISPTGFVGPLTRSKLNAAISATSSSTTTTTPSLLSGAASLSKEPLPRLYIVQPQQVKLGGTVSLVGAGFQGDNTVHIGSYIFSHVVPQDSDNISFTFPATSTIPNGTYAVWVENNYGTSKVVGQNINLVITDNPQAGPVISSVTPAVVSNNETVTIVGSGFASSNSVISGFGTLSAIVSSGTQITFSPRALLSADVLKRLPSGTSLKIDFYVLSGNSVSNVPGSVTLKI